MKRTMIVGLAVLMGLMIAGNSHAADSCGNQGKGFMAIKNVNIESMKKFLKDTSEARNELIIKRIELMKEFQGKTGDYDKIAKIQKEIIDLKTQVMDSAKKYGLDKVLLHWLKMRRSMMKHGRMEKFGHCSHGWTGHEKAAQSGDTGATSN